MMHDDRLSDFGNNRIREYAPEGDGLRERLGDRARYYAALVLSLMQLAAALSLVFNILTWVLFLSLDDLHVVALNVVLFVVAIELRSRLERGWWWADD